MQFSETSVKMHFSIPFYSSTNFNYNVFLRCCHFPKTLYAFASKIVSFKLFSNGDQYVLIKLFCGQYFADRDIFCAGRVTEEDLQRVAAATGGTEQTTVNNVIDEVLGSCENFEERQVGNDRVQHI
ncbi:PREDICTED: T-complex protein 1 subunit eta-like [Ipomoea nil]|uniref:T-complex protein 1 subunit eta-like n=1 Tax=Ipomoea nil TaxID=35883 RepID=UPI000901382B|nr:PREDICTED: T-complex protein 1 subunit eta-like [Ipomoea nil]